MLKHVKGNLIDLAEQGMFNVVVHGCNCQNTMGSGIAKEIRDRYPLVYDADSSFMQFDMPVNKLGNFSTARALGHRDYGHRFTVVNAYTQVNFMPRGVDHFEYDSFGVILRKLASLYPTCNFGFPYIGMSLAGGNKEIIIPMLEGFANKVTSQGGTVTLVEFKWK